jgi:uncharacterized protein involved in cysteine biosynthesis
MAKQLALVVSKIIPKFCDVWGLIWFFLIICFLTTSENADYFLRNYVQKFRSKKYGFNKHAV